MIMPDTSTLEVRRIRVSRRLLVGFAIGTACVFLTCASAILHGAFMWKEARENGVLRAENEALRARLEGVDLRLDTIDQIVERVKQFDNKLRTITMVSDPERNLAIGPVGGDVESPRSVPPQPDLRRDLLGSLQRSIGLVENRLFERGDALEALERSVSALSTHLEDQQALLASTPSRAPARGFVSSLFGMRVDPFTGLAQLHAGVDYSANVGARVSSTADGLVIFAGQDGAYGKQIKIDHGNGLVSQYAHLSQTHVKVGDQVKRGSLIGAVGNTGRSTGPHLHYEIRLNGVPQDPRRFLLE